MKIETYSYPDCKSKVSANELIRTTHTFYTRTLIGIKETESLWIQEEVKIQDGLEVLLDVETFYGNKMSLRDRDMRFGEYPSNATIENLQLELVEFIGVISKFKCECILREYTCKMHEYNFWNKKLDIYDVWRILDLEEEHGL